MATAAETRERPILFSAPMVRAILAGHKTQTRRIVKPQPPRVEDVHALAGIDFHLFTDEMSPGVFRVAGPVWAVRKLLNAEPGWRCPYGDPGDRLWVRETWAPSFKAPKCQVAYRADGRCYGVGGDGAGDNLHIFHGWLIDSKVRGDQLGDTLGRSLYQPWKPSIHMPRWASRITLEIADVRVERLQEISEEAATAEGFEAVQSEPWWQGYRDNGLGELLHQEWRGEKPPAWMMEPRLMGGNDPLARTALSEFRLLWGKLNGPRGFGWETNPWVWVIEFRIAAFGAGYVQNPPEKGSGGFPPTQIDAAEPSK